MAKRRAAARRIPKARRLAPAELHRLLHRLNMTGAEFRRVTAISNERNTLLNTLANAVNELRRDSDVQFKRIAQIQADLDEVKRRGSD